MKLFNLTVIILSFVLSACLQSPILNHANADSNSTASIDTKSADCAFEFNKLSLCAFIEWTKKPSDEEKGEFVIRFYDPKASSAKGPYIDPGYTVSSKLWMPSMGHGSSPVKVNQLIGSDSKPVVGVYNASEVYFMMPGLWEIYIILKQDKTVIDQAKIEVNI